MQHQHSLRFAHDRPHRTGAALRAAINFTVTAPANLPPSISITAPANNATFTAPATVHVSVSAADSDGTVTQVQYYDGVPPSAHLLGTLTTAPYSTDLLAQVAGDYTVVAVATDNSGAQTSSSILSFTVNASAGAAQVFYIHTDQLDTPRLITDSNNSAVWRWDNFDAFGDNPPNDDPSATGLHFIYNPRFAGQYFDQETRLNYNYFRDYDTGTGRYVESDPIGLEGGSYSTYAYVEGNPLWYIDEDGLMGNAPGHGAYPAGQGPGGQSRAQSACMIAGGIVGAAGVAALPEIGVLASEAASSLKSRAVQAALLKALANAEDHTLGEGTLPKGMAGDTPASQGATQSAAAAAAQRAAQAARNNPAINRPSIPSK